MITHEANSFSNILVNLRDLRGELRNSAREIEEHRKIPLNIIERLRDIGIFGMCFPQSWGGAGLTSIEQILVLEELAWGDTATAWCAMIGCDSGIYSGFLEEKSAKEIFPHANLAVAGWIHPQGKAEIVDGGYIVTGKWRFASGSPHGDVISAGCFLYRNGNLILDDNGKPLWRVMLARPADYLFSDTWFTTGLRGSGSQDYSTQELFIPEQHAFNFSAPKRQGPLHKTPDAILRKMAGIPLGLARACLDYIYDVADDRTDRINDVKWRNSKRVQTAVANAENQLFITRNAVLTSVSTLWQALEADAAHDDITHWRVQSALSRRNAFQTARTIVSSLYDLQGGGSIYTHETPFDRALRDINTICQHAVAQEKVLQVCGDILLGGKVEDYFI